MLGASALKLVKFGFSYTGLEIAILIAGVLTAFLVSVLAIKFLMKYIKSTTLKYLVFIVSYWVLPLLFIFQLSVPQYNYKKQACSEKEQSAFL